ncbi:hypothetical protein PQ478_19445 [Alkalihalophilus pseudofirmus]|uniref:hypothetical protein n=1 Tax=Alkalihalophilus pseudofirmus TaxID=79885 RepID=UPI00259BBC1A|nr:hypothetical protein [Alkalihalophilus pseudofirmus]WEG16654.1 hypothetical protein PQ478_19445 [Alkalihalophilus pseudofirmus]
MENKKMIRIVIAGVLIIILSTSWIHYRYLYPPFTYTNGLINEQQLSFTDFKSPVFIQGIRDEADHTRWFSSYITDEHVVRNILNYYNDASALEISNEQRNLAYEQGLARYEIIVRQVEEWRGDGHVANGRVLLQFRFYEDRDYFYIDENTYYELTDEFRQVLMKSLSDVEWHQW